MNRKQRREIQRNLQKKGLTKTQAKQIVETYYSGNPLEEGAKVKLNYELMVRHPDWKILRKDFREWVEAHKDEVFTVEWDERRKKNDTKDKKLNVCLKEDTTNPKWLFHSDTLIPQISATITLNNGKTIDAGVVEDANREAVEKAVNEALERERQKTGGN